MHGFPHPFLTLLKKQSLKTEVLKGYKYIANHEMSHLFQKSADKLPYVLPSPIILLPNENKFLVHMVLDYHKKAHMFVLSHAFL